VLNAEITREEGDRFASYAIRRRPCSITSRCSTTGIVVALGIAFQIPAVIFVLSRIGLVTARMLAYYFRQAVLAAVVLAVILTPTTDFGNMLILAGPKGRSLRRGHWRAWVFGKRRDPESR